MKIGISRTPPPSRIFGRKNNTLPILSRLMPYPRGPLDTVYLNLQREIIIIYVMTASLCRYSENSTYLMRLDLCLWLNHLGSNLSYPSCELGSLSIKIQGPVAVFVRLFVKFVKFAHSQRLVHLFGDFDILKIILNQKVNLRS